jgi:hypothetical protein
MKRLSSAVAALSLLALSGCIAEQPATGDTLAKIDNQCKAYGFKPGTDQFSGCILQLDQNRIASNRQARTALGQAMSDTGAQMQQNAANQQMINAANRPLNCTSTPSYGGAVRTSCY